jgi:arsenite methyltransferase
MGGEMLRQRRRLLRHRRSAPNVVRPSRRLYDELLRCGAGAGVMLNRFLARQLTHPGAILGPIVLAPMWNRRNAALNDAALEAMALSPEDRVLEVGFGGGYLLRRICAEVKSGLVAGVDVSEAMVDYVQRRERRLTAVGRLILKRASAEELPFPDDTFTGICSVNSIFYWQDPEPALAEMSRVGAAGARLVLCFTDKDSLAPRGFSRHGVNLLSAEDIQAMTERSGFRTERLERLSDRHRQFWCLAASR